MKQLTNYDGNLLNRFAFLLLTLNVVFSLSQRSCAQTAPDASGTFAAPNGTNLALGNSCYTITAGTDGKEQPIGFVFQSLELGYVAGPMSQHLGGDCAGLR